MATLRKLTKRIIIATNFIVAFFFLLACTNAFLHPDKWWFVSLLGLVFPLLLFIVFVFFIFWLLLSSREWAAISLITMIIGWSNIHAFLAFHVSTGFRDEKQPGALRVLTWNVREWDEFTTQKPGVPSHREKMMEFLKDQNADLMCFQEFFESHNPKELTDNIEYIQKQLKYPYYFFSHDYHRFDGVLETGVIIFSRYPVVQTLQQKFKKAANIRASESLIATDINVDGNIIRLFTTHLQSVLFRGKDFHNIEIIKNAEDSILEASKSIVKKLKRAYSFRSAQADLVRQELDASPHPNIVCGDFNDVPNSYTYFHIRGNMQDAFIQKGFGIGRSYVNLSPTLRIDYILASPEFTVLQCKRVKLPYSDHHPIVADLELNQTAK
jgi:endonuclease/exonuclease/phosphatase family metal-dependent hydrolase